MIKRKLILIFKQKLCKTKIKFLPNYNLYCFKDMKENTILYLTKFFIKEILRVYFEKNY